MRSLSSPFRGGARPAAARWRYAACLPLILLGAQALAAPQPCEAPPPGPRDLEGTGYYTDAAHSQIDPALQARNQAQTRPLNDYARRVADLSDAYLAHGDAAAGQCALTWLASWAKDGAMLGRMIHGNNDQADYLRQWTHGAAALAYLKTLPLATPAQRGIIGPWLEQLSRANLAYWEDPRHQRNNHYYWTGVGILATAIANDDACLRRGAQTIYRKGVDDIQADGSLPMEMARGARALHYHDYAAAPLVMMAQLADESGQDWYAYREGALGRLARRVAKGYLDSAWFARHAGVAQQDGKPHGFSGWIEFYRLHAPNTPAFSALHAAGPFDDPRLGGNLTLMAAHGIVPRR
ncbi:alginate lyase family protein [Achromobacter sp. 2789STDY5608621]|uniref:alginate lyase family protein n=1 Tax=Achromobacter sp. 2789STDY5608621 TaxID=1806496 RepID=UPI0006C02552|nr:alginate lyase family protein [Achromobacter sp. 2789STDY5608621]CUJ39326.1 Alginate lyase precursor [Achromobacter sp. 2789STDY5608621]